MNVLGITLKFDAAHFLPGYKGACSNMHGHTWRVDFEFCYDGAALDECGISCDFKNLKAFLKVLLPDHKLLNDIVPKPSAENLVEYFRHALSLVNWKDMGSALVSLQSIRVWESEAAFAEWRA